MKVVAYLSQKVKKLWLCKTGGQLSVKMLWRKTTITYKWAVAEDKASTRRLDPPVTVAGLVEPG